MLRRSHGHSGLPETRSYYSLPSGSAMDHKESIRHAITSDLSGTGRGLVTCLSGPWGSGKTHLWREIEPVLRKAGKRTAYLSLFGITSIAEARSGVVNGLVLADASPDDTKSHKAILDLKSLVLKATPWLSKYADAKFGFELLSKNLDLTRFIAPDSVVCLDDLERLSAQFKLEDALGFANLLAEQRGCRVLLVMNETHLEQKFPAEVETLKAYRERVVRRFLRVEPNLIQVLPHILQAENIALAPAAATAVLDTLLQAGCQNIRTMIRALEHTRDLASGGGSNVDILDVRLVTALASEQALGRLREPEFYEFEPIVFAMRGTVRHGKDYEVPETEIAQEAFFTSYYGDGTYRFDAHVYGLIRNGYLNVDEYQKNRQMRTSGPQTRWGQLRARIDARDCLYLSDAEAGAWVQESYDVLRGDHAPAAHITSIYQVAEFVARWASIDLPADFATSAREALLAAARRGDRSLDSRTLIPRERGSLAPAIEAYESELLLVSNATDRHDLLMAINDYNEDAFRTVIRRVMPRSAELALDPGILVALNTTLPNNRRFYFSCLSALAYISKEIRSEKLRDGLKDYVKATIGRPFVEHGDKVRFGQVLAESDFPSSRKPPIGPPPQTEAPSTGTGPAESPTTSSASQGRDLPGS